ncbi:MAG TPA: MarR family winged helix-turn-helix transcriptional regulator [Verrucomicrobiae bacterium]|nr:MarR family winged helix-turn-helix transcriptional regulator [Verrucomicrobiae bacterium]
MAKKLDFTAMENCVCVNLRLVTRTMTRFFDAERRRMGVRPTQTPILRALTFKNWGMAELSDRLAMERTTLVRNLRPLEREGLVKVKGGGRGGRVELMITDKGRKKLAEAYPAWRSAQDKIVAILGKDRWTNMIRDLDHVAETLKKQ